jgi:hypothetical protein
VAAALAFATAGSVMGADKSAYSILNPTPDQLLRDMTTDRPDTTESPFTVDAGRVQVETNVFAFARSRPDEDGVVTDSYELVNANVRIGITSETEIGFVWQSYGIARSRHGDPMTSFRDDGIGGLDVRGKVNLWGNDAFAKPGDTALALLPFLTLPTDDDNGISPEDVEGGLLVPLAVNLPRGFGLGINAGVLRLKDDDASGYHTDYVATAALSYEWSDALGTYYEVATQFGEADIVVLGTGATYALSPNTQLDAGINVGVTRAADRINPFVGISTRF